MPLYGSAIPGFYQGLDQAQQRARYQQLIDQTNQQNQGLSALASAYAAPPPPQPMPPPPGTQSQPMPPQGQGMPQPPQGMPPPQRPPMMPPGQMPGRQMGPPQQQQGPMPPQQPPQLPRYTSPQAPPQQPPQQAPQSIQPPPQGQDPSQGLPPPPPQVTAAIQSALPNLHDMASKLQEQGIKGMPLYYALMQHKEMLSQEGKQQLAELNLMLRKEQADNSTLRADAALKNSGTKDRAEDRYEGKGPDAKSDLRQSQVELNQARADSIRKKAASGGGSGKGGGSGISDDDAKFLGDMRAKGDSSAMTGLGTGAVGAANRAKVTKYWREASQGDGADAAATDAEYFGTKASERALGTRSANIGMAVSEAKRIAPIVLKASNAVDRTKYPMLNEASMRAMEASGDPNVVRLSSSLNSFINIYSRAVAGGPPTVSDKDHAREILNKYWSKGQIEAGIDVMTQEMGAATASPGDVRKELRDTVTGGGRSDQDKQAMEWAKANPNDPRAAQIKQRLGM